MSSFPDLFSLPDRLRAAVEGELAQGERIVWLDQPIPGRFARAALPGVVIGIPFTAFAVFWMTMAGWGLWGGGGGPGPGPFFLFPLFGLPFVLAGLGMLTSPLWAARRARRTAYAITDRRAIVFLGGWRGAITVQSFEPRQLGQLKRTQHPDGSGDLIFTQDFQEMIKHRQASSDVGFLAVRGVKQVEDKVRALAQQAAD